MKKILLTFLTLSNIFLFSQNNYATLFIYRPSQMYGSMANHYIKINNREVATLKSGGYLEYKAYNETELDIAANAKAMGVPSIAMTHLKLKVEKGKTYYVKVYPEFVTVGLEELKEPIPAKKLKDNKSVNANDLGVITKNSEWTKDKLVQSWEENGIEEIEGIYQKVGNSIDYNLALVKQDNNYKLIYLSGASENKWKEGDVKAELKKTANYGVFMATWFTKDGAKDVVFNINNGIFKVAEGNTEDSFVKVFPTYETKIKRN